MGASQGEIPADGGTIRPTGFQARECTPRRRRRRFNSQFSQHEVRGDRCRGLESLGVIERFEGANWIVGPEACATQRLPHRRAFSAMLHRGFQAPCGRGVVAFGVQRGRYVAIEPRPQIVVSGFAGCRVQRVVKGLAGRRAVSFGGVANPQADQMQRRQPDCRSWGGVVNRQQGALGGGIDGACRQQVRNVVSAILDVRHAVGRVRAAA